MRDIVSGIGAQVRTDVQAVQPALLDRMHTIAVYGAFALIAAVVFGTLSYHPF